MKTITIIICAVLSLSIGIACASPLLVSELNIQPWIKHVQGPTAEFGVNVIYANFTITNETKPIEKTDGPTISYQVVVNITNPSDLGANLLQLYFTASQKITNSTGMPYFGNGTASGSGWRAEGAWVDGKWYNVTYSNGTIPYFDRNGTMAPYPFNMPEREATWKAGVEIYDRYVDGILIATYLNMNGTWTDVTGRIDVVRPPQGTSYSHSDIVISETDSFENTAVREYTNGISVQFDGLHKTVHHLVENGYFDNYWAPHQSRLLLLSGDWAVRKPFGSTSTIGTLKAGNLTFKTTIMNFVKDSAKMVNNTVVDTWSDETELKQVQLMKSGTSYVYNAVLDANQMFQPDKWGVEVTIKLRS